MKQLGTLAFAGAMLALALAFAVPSSAAPATSGLGKSQVAPGVTSQVEQVRRHLVEPPLQRGGHQGTGAIQIHCS